MIHEACWSICELFLGRMAVASGGSIGMEKTGERREAERGRRKEANSKRENVID